MGELFLISMIVTLVILSIRSGRPVILETPLIIHRVGQYHITLAPQLNRAQTFIEQIVHALATAELSRANDSDSLFFRVHDEKLCPTGEHFYLLAITRRAGQYYFQAILPKPLLHDADRHEQTIREFATSVLREVPLGDVDEFTTKNIAEAVLQLSARLSISIEPISATD